MFPEKDLNIILESSYIPWDELKNKRILVTGATGLIGINLVYYIYEYSKRNNLGIHLIALVRNKEKLKDKLSSLGIENKNISVINANILNPINLDLEIDYVIHTAATTSSLEFVERPVETIDSIVNGTFNILRMANEKNVKKVVYLSTMELFGKPTKNQIVNEDVIGSFDTRVIRNSYPLSKQIAENLCCAFANEYNLSVNIVRLTQTFGPGVEYTDKRVFAEIARNAIEKKDIVLKTKGLTERCYLYTVDAVTAILTVLLKGDKSQIYVASNDSTYCSIYEIAKKVADKNRINVVIEESDIKKLGYADELHMKLSSEKLTKLGWKPKVGIEEMFERLIDSFQ